MTRPITRPMVRLGDNGNTRVIKKKKGDAVFCPFKRFTMGGAALHDDSQVVEHAQGSAVTYREHHNVDKHKGKQEVDEMDNQVAWRGKKKTCNDTTIASLPKRRDIANSQQMCPIVLDSSVNTF